MLAYLIEDTNEKHIILGTEAIAKLKQFPNYFNMDQMDLVKAK